MKKYIIKDEDGKVVEVSEYENEKPADDPADPADPAEKTGDEPFSPEQVEAIKNIVAAAISEAMKSNTPKTPDTTSTDTDPKETEDPKVVIDPNKAHDSVSKTGPTSVETRKPIVHDSAINEEDVNTAWSNRFRRG